jgi:hypothetical protein
MQVAAVNLLLSRLNDSTLFISDSQKGKIGHVFYHGKK